MKVGATESIILLLILGIIVLFFIVFLYRCWYVLSKEAEIHDDPIGSKKE